MNEEKENNKTESAWGLAWELGYSIAGPLVVLAWGGRFLDKKLNTAPWLLLLGIILSIALSSYIVYKKTTQIIDK